MQKRGITVIAILSLVLAVSLFVISTAGHEPFYAGSPLSYWGIQLVENRGPTDSPQPYLRAEQAIKDIGTNALPFLAKWIRHETPLWRRKLPAAVGEWLPESIRIDRKEMYAEAAVDALKVLGPAAASLIPELETLMNDPVHWQTSDRATRALPYLGTNALRPLLKALQQPSQICRTHVADAVGDFLELHPDATSAIPVLVACLTDNEVSLRAASAGALGNPKLPPAAIVPPLMAALESPDRVTRWSAALALGQCGSNALAAATALQHATNDADYDVRLRAAESLTAVISNTPPR